MTGELCREGSGCKLLLPLERSFSDGIGCKVGAIKDVLSDAGCDVNRGWGLPACENKIHPPRKEIKLATAMMTRRPIFKGFILSSFQGSAAIRLIN
jgi:hypothetical protein